MKALRFDGDLELVRDAPIPRREGEALIQVIAAGICNTDLEITKGYAGFRGTLGHEFVGRVVESSEISLVGQRVVGEINVGCDECQRCREGDARHCPKRTVLGIKGRDGAFAEFVSLPVGNLKTVPEAVSDEAAVFVEPLAAALNILEQVSIACSSDVVIVGDGKLAQLIVLALAQTGCSISVIGRYDEKLDMAGRFGAGCVLRESATTGPEWNGRFDVAIEASGSASGLRTALRVVKPRGAVVLKSTHHGETPVDTSQVVVNEVILIGSRCGRFDPAIELLNTLQTDLSPLISRRLPLEEGMHAFREAAAARTMKVILQMGRVS